MQKPELLSPAGNLTKLKIALSYGADAVYASVGSFSLRKRSAKEFTKESFIEGVNYTHKLNKKFYATINGFINNHQIEGIKDHILFLKDIGVDGFIVASVAVMSLVKELAPDIELHISTQANIMNYMDAKIYKDLGASRIVLAREVSINDIKEIKKRVKDLEIEAFCHGSMCFAYSGRCLISALQSGRFSNRGSCANDCRFNYELYAKSEVNNSLFRLEEDGEFGTRIMNAKDLNTIGFFDKILDMNIIDSFKIEGRTKSEYYVACATKAYRNAIDDYFNSSFDVKKYEYELNTLQNRGFSDGYLFKKPYERPDTQNHINTMEMGTHQVHAITYDGEFFNCKWQIFPNISYEIFSPNDDEILEVNNEIGEIYKDKDNKFYMKFKKLITKKGEELAEIHSGNLNEVRLVLNLPKFSFLRKKI